MEYSYQSFNPHCLTKISYNKFRRKVSGYNIIHSAKKSEERKTDTSLGKIAHKKSSIKPTVVLADSNEEFKSYLEECLSKDFDVKSFGNGSEALECIKRNILI